MALQLLLLTCKSDMKYFCINLFTASFWLAVLGTGGSDGVTAEVEKFGVTSRF